MNSTLQDASNKEAAGIAIVVLVLVVSPIIIILVRNAVATIQVSKYNYSIFMYNLLTFAKIRKFNSIYQHIWKRYYFVNDIIILFIIRNNKIPKLKIFIAILFNFYRRWRLEIEIYCEFIF